MAEKTTYTFEMVEEMYRKFNPSFVDGNGRKVVIAEDNPAMLKVLVKSVESKGFEVTGVADGLEALKSIRDLQPDLVLLDIQMPKATGIAVLDAMRKDERFVETPVVMVTAKKDKKDVIMAHKLKAAGYILKPFKMDDLIAKIAEIFNS
jgi:DNA-binding response OmpR family regulator